MTFKILTLTLATAAAIALGLGSPSFAQDKHNHASDEKGGHADKAHFTVTAPADVKAAWIMITESISSAEAKPDAVHEAAEKLEVAFHALGEKSLMVTGDAKTRLASVLKQADKANDALHHGAEDKDTAKVSAEIKKIKALLPLIEAQFPAGALK